jgi:Mg/Co/Ni transporter MgtE
MTVASATAKRDSAVMRVTDKFLSVGEEEATGKIKKAVVYRAKELEVIDYICLVGESRFLPGVVLLKDVLQAHDGVPVKRL